MLLQRITIKDAEVRFIRCEKSRISTALGVIYATQLCANCEKIKHNSSQIAILRKNTIK
ncbi:hypothetical protein HMPREF3204_00544 [Gardnerella pickettii]|uniref:Uncharacterized protein n=1 Tax=Gardnerella pickettii JCP8017A TaxID=1261062 RepID=T2PIH1_9BIFI|nr:hypothetical protein HMPREF1577_01461 [Gardnerella pickettii JCP8017A]EPI59315.1 hypothetical protein HMPREF1578_01331 [Gardnerella pickettii JCP8017B]KXA16371.1 hypothetical protein HMPREF3204_00544 [Gardnerella pickettii]